MLEPTAPGAGAAPASGIRAAYRKAEGVRWSVEVDGITLLREPAGKSLFLGYPDAALWDFLSRGLREREILSRMRALLKSDEAGARAEIFRILARLERDGFLKRE